MTWEVDLLKKSYRKLSRTDARNDSQVLFYVQVIPGSALTGYVNADHWAMAVPIGRSHTTVRALFVTQNAYPREALLEALPLPRSGPRGEREVAVPAAPSWGARVGWIRLLVVA